MRPRVLVISEIPTPYRVPLFRAIAASGAVDLEVLFCAREQPDRPWALTTDLQGFQHRFMPGVRIPVRTRKNTFVYEINPTVIGHLAKKNYDIVVVGGYSVFAEQVAIAFARISRVPYVVHAESHHGKSRRRSVRVLKGLVLPQVVGAAVAGMAAGSAAARYLASYGIPPDRIRIVPNTVDIAAYTADAESARAREDEVRSALGLPPRYVLFAGRLVEEKGILDLVAALERLGNAAPMTLIAGTGQLELELAGVPNVRLIGFQTTDRLIQLLALADKMVLPSRGEPWGVVVNEALACGCPVIVSDAVGAAEDLVRPGIDGLVIPVGDIGALAAALQAELPRPNPRRGPIAGWTYEFGVGQFLEAIELSMSSSSKPTR